MNTKAIPVLAGRCLSNSVNASNPPAEAPTPTTGISLSSRPRTRDAPAVSALAADLLADRLPALRFAAVPVFFLAGEAFFFFAVGLGPATADLARADFFATMVQPPISP